MKKLLLTSFCLLMLSGCGWDRGTSITYCSGGDPLGGLEMRDGVVITSNSGLVMVSGEWQLIMQTYSNTGVGLYVFQSGYGEQIFPQKYCIRKDKPEDHLNVYSVGGTRGRSNVK